jgi:ATP phosphoribosyltransferase regulatory subunit
MFGDKTKLAEALKTQITAPGTLPFKGMDFAAIVKRVEAEMETFGLLDSGGRTPEDITARLMEKRVLAASGISAKAREILTAFLALECPLHQAEAALKHFETTHQIRLGIALQRFSARLVAMRLASINAATITFRASFGRSLDYYSAMQFEIYGLSPLPLIGGGRYNRLMTLLGATRPIPAVGFSMWLDRVEAIT